MHGQVAGVRGGPQRLDQLAQRGGHVVAETLGRALGRGRLDQEAKLGDLGHGLLAYLGHERAAVRDADDQPLVFQPREGLAQRGSG